MDISHTITNLIIFVLAIYLGYHVVWTVTPGASRSISLSADLSF